MFLYIYLATNLQTIAGRTVDRNRKKRSLREFQNPKKNKLKVYYYPDRKYSGPKKCKEPHGKELFDSQQDWVEPPCSLEEVKLIILCILK